MPRDQFKNDEAIQPPFFGLQEVKVLPLKAGTNQDQLLKICHTNCRSTAFLLIDTFQQIPDDFVMGAMTAHSNGQTSFSNYNIYSELR